jgi:predicted GIY-YIG superfamily endonuclease
VQIAVTLSLPKGCSVGPSTSNNIYLFKKRINQIMKASTFLHLPKRRMVTLRYYERFTDVKQAIAREKQLKEALLNEDYDLLKALSRSDGQ